MQYTWPLHNLLGISRYVFYTEDGRQASSLEDLNGRTVEVAEAPRSQQKMAYARMMADRQSAGSSSGMSPSSGNDSEKPRMSYAQLIAEALVNAPDGMLTLSEIYNAISARHPYYKMEARNWQNSIRHNLTLNKSFTKVPRMSSSEGRGSYWKLEPGAESIIFKRSARNVNKSNSNSANTSISTSLNLSAAEVTTRIEAMKKNGYVACAICSEANNFDNHSDVLDHYSTVHQIKIHGCEGIFSPKVKN